MSGIDAFRYDGKRVLVVGGATGMGAAAAQTAGNLGAEVIVMDYAPVEFPAAQTVKVDLGDPADIDRALAEVQGPIHAVFAAAGIADGPVLMKVNFLGHRHLLDALLADGRLGRGAAVCMISSAAGLGWDSNMEQLLDFLSNESFDTGWKWIEAHEGTNNYAFGKQAMNAYVAQQAYPLLKQGIRINAVCPGPTDTPLARANADLWLTYAQDYREATSTETLQPEDIGDVMVFLNSDAARGVSGEIMIVDRGHTMSSYCGSYEQGQQLVKMLMGKV